MRKPTLFFGVLVTSILVAGLALAQPGPQGKHQAGHAAMMGKGMGMMHGGMAGLALTDEQKAKAVDLRLALQKETEPLRAKLGVLRSDMKLILTSDSPDQKKVSAKNDEISKVQSDLHMAFLKHVVAFRAILTPEQKTKFDSHLLSMRGGMGGFGGFGDGPRGHFRGMGPQPPADRE